MQNLRTAAEATHAAGLAQALRKGLEGNHQRQGEKNSYKPTAQNESLISLFPSEQQPLGNENDSNASALASS